MKVRTTIRFFTTIHMDIIDIEVKDYWEEDVKRVVIAKAVEDWAKQYVKWSWDPVEEEDIDAEETS